MDIVLAETEPGILYVEGFTDIKILREWAQILRHPLLSFLNQPFWRATAEMKPNAKKHFSAIRKMIGDFRGVALYDGDNKGRSNSSNVPKGMQQLYWQRYEIESYLLHPDSIQRYIESKTQPQYSKIAVDYMKKEIPLAWRENPFGLSDYLRSAKAKTVLSKIFQVAELSFKETEFYQVATQMTVEEIHPEVIEKLDAIAVHLNLEKAGGADE